MKTVFLQLAVLFSFSFFITNEIFAQADLIISDADMPFKEAYKGQLFLSEALIENIGNVTAPANYLNIYYSKDLSFDKHELVGRVAVKELAPNESQGVNFLSPIPIRPSFSEGNYHVLLKLDPFNQVSELEENNDYGISDENQNFLTFHLKDQSVTQKKLTQPIIFVHGWTGSSKTWDRFRYDVDSLHSWSYGGRLDYCLNPDGDVKTSDTSIKSFIKESQLSNADYYLVNFDINNAGELFVGYNKIFFRDQHSNQSAIVKQGWAIHDAVKRVLNLTKAKKVMLVGHSMGGLAIREYLQNPSNWQNDGEHHISKIVTIGTPNGGSNITSGTIVGLAGYDERSEAVRDLRYKNFIFDGAYLDGGTEDNISLFHNDDVDCNGYVGDKIIGLNEKTAPSDVNYACIIGNIREIHDDGIVDGDRADLNNYLFAAPPLGKLQADRFIANSTHSNIHKNNPAILMAALDEPPFYDESFPTEVNTYNYGYITTQASNTRVPSQHRKYDWDDFTIDIKEEGTLEMYVWNIPVHDFKAYLLDQFYGIYQKIESEGNSNIRITQHLRPGKYYIEFGGVPTNDSWKHPYAFTTFFTPDSDSVIVATNEVQELLDIKIYPNPSNGLINIEDNNNLVKFYELYNSISQRLYAGAYNGQVLNFDDGPGIYFLRLYDRDRGLVKVEKVVIR